LPPNPLSPALLAYTAGGRLQSTYVDGNVHSASMLSDSLTIFDAHHLPLLSLGTMNLETMVKNPRLIFDQPQR